MERDNSSRVSYDDIVALDKTLKRHNLRRHSVMNDGNSFYSAVSHQLALMDNPISAESVRIRAIRYLRQHTRIDEFQWLDAITSGESKESYLLRHSCDDEPADDVMIQATASSLDYVINILTSEEAIQFACMTKDNSTELIVARVNGSSYISVEGKYVNSSELNTRIFNFSDRATSRGILKQTTLPSFSDKSSTIDPIHENGPDNDQMTSQHTMQQGPGLNPIDDEYTDEFLDGEEEPLIEVPPYDQFICEPPEDDSRTATNTLKFFTKAFKFFSYFIFGGAVFGAALVSKAALMVLMNSAKPYISTDTDAENVKLEHDIVRAWSYIIILATLLFPEVLTMTYSFYRIVMKPESKIDLRSFLWGAVWEVVHAFGEALLFLRVLPHFDATYAILFLPLVGIIPICIHIHSKVLSVTHNKKKRNQQSMQRKRIRNLVMAITAFILQLGGLLTVFLHFFVDDGGTETMFAFLGDNSTFIWAFVAILLTSVRFWENFVSDNFNFTEKIKIRAQDLHNKMDNGRFQTAFVYSLLKCLILVGMTFLIFLVMEDGTYTSEFVLGKGGQNGPEQRYTQVFSLLSHNSRSKHRSQIIQILWYVFAVQGCSAVAAFYFSRVACMTMAQMCSSTLPTVLITPVLSAVSAALWVYKLTYGPNKGLLEFFGLGSYGVKGLSYYIDWNYIIPKESSYSFDPTLAGAVMTIVGLFLGWLGILLITHYMWHNPSNRLEKMEVLYVKPIYGGPMIDQVLLLNRRQYEKAYSKNKQKKDEEDEKKRHEKEERRKSSSNGRSVRRKSSRRATISRGHKFVPQLFLCATMWHETESEMTQILTSLMRLDRDQGSRRSNAPNDDDYYNFQVHVLFDDAMERTKDGKEIKTNKWVHQLCDLIPLAANKVELGKGYDLPPPVIYPTPYGGRLEFIMPHGNLLVVHLKDKEKIRHRKRWSQCMYMYYILGYLQATKKAYKLEDVFLLALDGDVDFQPNAVLLLLDRMKRNPDVGAACGRIHPTGSGPVVWFQKFEYAVGHWLQKTAEHVLGCVLCSPGCFSLFRGAALVDVNVMNQYTTKASEARHYVQWDQGEDRWLCTLLLKQGWRIEYSAASDSFTFAPEDFKEFYNQRRRWGPSTMANIFDILMDAKMAVTNNIYISWGYISYQLGLMISSLLGPATVVMIVQGAFQYVFQWTATVALIVSLIPVLIFIILCYTTSADTQVAVAGILTILYALVMMAVVVGVVGAMATNILLDPNNLFMIMLVGMYAFTGIMHPQEMTCLLHGMLYYLCVPSAFILLMVYSLTNMDNVSWGTREVKKPVSETENANQQALEAVASKQSKGKNFQVGPGGSIYDGPSSPDGYYSCGLGNLCQCALCITPQPVVYQPIAVSPPSPEVHQAPPSRRHTLHRRPTMGSQARQSVYKKFSTAKARQMSGLDDQAVGQKIEQSLQKRMSLAQLRRISSRIGRDSISTSKLRRMSTQHRRMSRRSTLGQIPGDDSQRIMSQAAHMLSDELAHEQFDDLSDDEFDDPIDPERMQDEEEEMLYWLIEGSLEDGVIEGGKGNNQIRKFVSNSLKNFEMRILCGRRTKFPGYKYLDNEERDFWKYLIDHYLYPLIEDKEEKARIKGDLVELRNRVTGAYFLLNALWLILNFALQLTITDIAIILFINGARISVNPVSFAFLIFFLVILVIQFWCMLVHRWSTALHLLSVTSLKWKDKRDGIKNVRNKDLEKEQERLKKKPKKKPGQNGQIANGVRDPLDPMDVMETDETPVNNFTYRERTNSSGAHDNPAYDIGNLERGECGSSSDDDQYIGNTYETINLNNRFGNNPANRLFATASRNYGSTDHQLDDDDDDSQRKGSTNIDLEIFNDQAPKHEEPKKSVLGGHGQDHRPHTSNVHFGPLPSDHEDEGNTSF